MAKNLIQQLKDKITGGEKKEKTSLYNVDGVFHIVQDRKDYILTNLPDGFVIKGNLDLSRKGLTELPDLSKVIVEGDFRCDDNWLTTLQGAPKEVGGCFVCNDNQLTTLQGASQEVGGDFICYKNKLTTLQGSPRKVGGDFRCGYNQLTSLEGAPQKVGGGFACRANKNLSSLAGLPKMSKVKEIDCDEALKEKYNCSKSEYGDIYYKDLIESAKYQSELSARKIRQKKHEEKEQKAAKFKSGYAAFKKQKQTKEREE